MIAQRHWGKTVSAVEKHCRRVQPNAGIPAVKCALHDMFSALEENGSLSDELAKLHNSAPPKGSRKNPVSVLPAIEGVRLHTALFASSLDCFALCQQFNQQSLLLGKAIITSRDIAVRDTGRESRS